VILEPEGPAGVRGQERVKIGQEESVSSNVVRARFRLIVTIRQNTPTRSPPRRFPASRRRPESYASKPACRRKRCSRKSRCPSSRRPAALPPGVHIRARRPSNSVVRLWRSGWAQSVSTSNRSLRTCSRAFVRRADLRRRNDVADVEPRRRKDQDRVVVGLCAG